MSARSSGPCATRGSARAASARSSTRSTRSALRPPAETNAPTPTDAMLALGTQFATFASATLFILFAGVIALTIVTLA